MNALPYLLPARVAGALLLLASAAACGSDTPAPAKDSGVAVLWSQIEAQRGDATCDAPEQCHSIGTGSKACGGPERYLAWSSKDNDGSRLKALVAQHAAARRSEDARSGMMSTCSVVPDPGATCVAGRCALRAAGLGGSEAR